MARRIVLAVLALVVAILGAVAVPLGLTTAGQDRRDFQDVTVTTATTMANAAEERIDDGAGPASLNRLVHSLTRAGDRAGVYGRTSAVIASTRPAPAVRPGWLARARASAGPAVYQLDDAIAVVAPVRNDSGNATIGVAVLVRPTTPVDQHVAAVWGLIAAVSVAGLLAAALIAFALARWVSRPLSELEQAAQRLGDGHLATRSPADAGPGEVRRLAANFNLMAARLEALVHGHQATMADVSHQLRTPLAALRLRLELLAQDSQDDLVGTELAGAQDEIARLSRLVNGLLAVARAENITTTPQVISVDTVIRNRVAAWRPAAEEQGIALSALVPDRVRARLGDGQLEQILDNLLANALDALQAGQSIHVSALTRADAAMITISDTGPGMSAEHKRLAFRRFATNSAGGTGLGLAIVDRLVTSNGGSATLSDTPGGGLTVTIELPAVTEDRGPRRASASRPALHEHPRD
jgi:signal transduction histidine kinase